MPTWSKSQQDTFSAADTSVRVSIYQSDVDHTYRFSVQLTDANGNQVASFDVPVTQAFPLQVDQNAVKNKILQGISTVLQGQGWILG